MFTGHRYDYRRIAALLRQEGWAIGKRQVQRLRRADGLRVPPIRRRLVRCGVSTGLPTKATRRGHVWTWDFMSEATVRGGALKMLTILDEFTRECYILRPDRAMRAADMLAWLERAVKVHGARYQMEERESHYNLEGLEAGGAVAAPKQYARCLEHLLKPRGEDGHSHLISLATPDESASGK